MRGIMCSQEVYNIIEQGTDFFLSFSTHYLQLHLSLNDLILGNKSFLNSLS